MGNWFSSEKEEVSINGQLVEISQGKLNELQTANEILADIKYLFIILMIALTVWGLVYAVRSTKHYIKKANGRIVV